MAAAHGSAHRSFSRLRINYAVEVLSVESQDPAGLAGLRAGDLIVAINGSNAQSVDDLHRFLSDWHIGRPVKIDIVRGQRRRVIVIVPKEAVE